MSGSCAWVSIALSPAVRIRGLSAEILNRGLEALYARHPEAVVRARVDRDNTASLKLFARCGFAERGSDGRFIVWERHRAGSPANTGDAA
jgi:RimJ/RimL family protein N-acetyltransferase